MKSKLLICHYCKEKFPSEELTQVTKTMRSCKKCIEIKKDNEENKKLTCHYCKEKFPSKELILLGESKRGCKQCITDRDDYKELIDYICTGFNQKAPTGKQVKDIRRFKELGISYKEIQWTLYYIFSVVGKKLDENNIGLVPYLHKEAMEHFLTIQRVKETSANIEIKEEITIVRKPYTKSQQAKFNKTRYVNIAEIL